MIWANSMIHVLETQQERKNLGIIDLLGKSKESHWKKSFLHET